MNKIKFLRILLFAFLSFSIISCTTTEEHYYYITPGDGSQTSGTGDGSQTPGTGDGSQTPGTGDGSQTPIPDKGYKKLIQMNIKYDNGDVEETRFSYDNNGMLQLIDYSYPAENYYEKFYLTLNNNIIYLSDSESENQELCEISGGKVVKYFLDSNNPVKYDNEGHLIEFSGYYMTWKDGKLDRLHYLNNYHSRILKYKYFSVPKKCAGYNPYMGSEIGELFEFSALPWLIGMDQQDLPQEIEITDQSTTNTETTTFNYTFYPDGYLKTCTLNITEIYGSGTEHETKYEKVEIYEYFWE